MASSKPQVLLVGEITESKPEFDKLSDIAQLVPFTSKSRDEFISDLKGKYSNVAAIYTSFNMTGAIGRFDEPVIAALPKSLKYIAHNGAGYDRLDAVALAAAGIQLSHTPSAVDAATADTNMYLMLGALRGFSEAEATLRANKFNAGLEPGHDPEGKVLGIIGMGGIGRAVRDRSWAFGFTKILYYNRRRLAPELEKGAQYVESVDELLGQCDVLSLNLPLNPSTKHTINAERLAKCKTGVVIVNTARGAVIDENALVEALDSGKVGSVGLDVYENEPKVHPGLLSNPRVCLLPHVGTNTHETRHKLELMALANIRAGLTEGKLVNIVPEQVGKF